LAENPKPVPSSFAIGDGHVEANEVASFHASTTYGPDAAIDVSDCPYSRTPAGLTSSAKLAALTLAGAPTLRLTAACPAAGPLGCEPKQNMCAPADAQKRLPCSRLQNGLPAASPVVGVPAARAEWCALAAPAGAAPPLVIANPMSGSVAAAPSHNLERIVVPLIRSPVRRPWRNSAGPEPPDVNEALPQERPHLLSKRPRFWLVENPLEGSKLAIVN